MLPRLALAIQSLLKNLLITPLWLLLCVNSVPGDTPSPVAPPWRDVALTPSTSHVVRPWTGVVLWHDSEHAATDAIAMEYSYVGYGDCVTDDGRWDWTTVQRRLSDAAGRGHQSVLRFFFVYPGKPASVPRHLRTSDYQPIWAKSEGERTEFVDWNHEPLRSWVLDFHREFAGRFDSDSRLAAVQVGFGLWGEYHIYDGPQRLGETFPDKSYQSRFLQTLDRAYHHTPWMISIDAADDELSPLADDRSLLQLKFGLFDDSFLSKQHSRWNEPNWRTLTSTGPDRYRGGELSYYTGRDQKMALSPTGPHGESLRDAAERFAISFMIGNDQPRYQTMRRIKDASLSLGYRLALTARRTNGAATRLTIKNIGIAAPPHPILGTSGQR